MDALELSDCKHFAETHLHPALGADLFEMALHHSPEFRLPAVVAGVQPAHHHLPSGMDTGNVTATQSCYNGVT